MNNLYPLNSFLLAPMKQYLLTSIFLASAALGWAVPAQINYQGRLTDANGDPVTGEVSMSLKMFDAATAGNELYSEDIGTVTLDDNGVYSFQFGASGQSVVATSESITSTDGVNQVFNATLANLPVDGSVSLSDGTYTWSQVNGSSSAADFTASVTPANGAVSAIYLSGAPTAGVEITATYDYLDASVVGALSSHESHWLELSVDGTAQSPRERVLSVPFAQVAGSLSDADFLMDVMYSEYLWDQDQDQGHSSLPYKTQGQGSIGRSMRSMVIDILPVAGVKTIETIKVPFKAENRFTSPPASKPPSSLNIRLLSRDRLGRNNDLFNADFTTSGAEANDIVTLEAKVNLPVDFSNRTYRLILTPKPTSSSYYGDWDRDDVVVYPINIQFSK
jgi:hypothetical protein